MQRTNGLATTRCGLCGSAAPADAPCPRCADRAAQAGAFTAPDPRNGFVRNYLLGLEYFFAGFTFLKRNPSLFRYILIPLAISVLLFGIMVYAALANLHYVLGLLEGDWTGWLELLREALYWVAWVLLAALGLLASFFLSFLLSTVINSPFYDLLSEKVEEIYVGAKFEEAWSWEYIKRMIVVPIRESIKLAVFQGLVMLALLVLSLLSAGAGTVVFAVAGAYFGALSIFDFVLARKYYSLREKRRYLRLNLGFIMGFGTMVNFLPFLTPFAVAGATLGFLASKSKG